MKKAVTKKRLFKIYYFTYPYYIEQIYIQRGTLCIYYFANILRKYSRIFFWVEIPYPRETERDTQREKVANAAQVHWKL